jgi:hypothetical protein
MTLSLLFLAICLGVLLGWLLANVAYPAESKKKDKGDAPEAKKNDHTS